MTDWKEFEVLRMNSIVNTDVDPILKQSFLLALDWANRMGLQGKETKGFYIEKSQIVDGLVTNPKIKCKWRVQDKSNPDHSITYFYGERADD